MGNVETQGFIINLTRKVKQLYRQSGSEKNITHKKPAAFWNFDRDFTRRLCYPS